MANGKPKAKRLTKADFLEKKFKATEGEVELPALGGTVKIRRMTVGQRRELPALTNDDGKPELTRMAATFAAVVVEPKFTVEEVEGFLDDLETTDLDALYLKLSELTGTKEDGSALEEEFPQAGD